jgi:internalin A
MRAPLVLAGLLSSLSFVGCGGGGTTPPTAPPAPVASSGASAMVAEAPPPAPEVTPFACGQVCRVTSITDDVKAALEAHGDEDTLVIEFPSTATMDQIATIEKLPWVKKLRLKGSNVTDISVVAKLENLETLALVNTQVQNVAPLAKLTHLKSMFVRSGNDLSDPWPGKPLTGKAEAMEKEAQTDVNPITPDADKEDFDEALPKSPKTDIDLSGLKDVVSLRDLRLEGIKVPDAVFGTLTQVTSLDLTNMTLTDPKQLDAMPLQELNMNKVFVPNYDFLKPMAKLEFLEITQNRLVDISFVPSLKSLRRLIVGENPHLVSLAPLKGNQTIESVDLDDDGVSDLKPLEGLPKLDFVDVQGTKVLSLAPLAKVPALRTINARRTEVKDLAGLDKLPALAHLHVPASVPKEKLEALRKAKPDLHVLVY